MQARSRGKGGWPWPDQPHLSLGWSWLGQSTCHRWRAGATCRPSGELQSGLPSPRTEPAGPMVPQPWDRCRKGQLSELLDPTLSFLNQTSPFLPEQPKTPSSPTLLDVQREGRWVRKQSQDSNLFSLMFHSNNKSSPCFKPWLLTAYKISTKLFAMPTRPCRFGLCSASSRGLAPAPALCKCQSLCPHSFSTT